MSKEIKEQDLYEGDDDSQEQDISFTEYDISASPNDFNVSTINSFISKGTFRIPNFQRNYIWDKKRASKLIESLLIGVPIPQVFLYEQSKNNFLVIDGQQRLLTIYLFRQKRFPKDDKGRTELRKIFREHKMLMEDVFANNEYFEDFNLSLPATEFGNTNKFNKLNYDTLSEEDKNTLDLRTIRNIIIKQHAPKDGDSVIAEIFERFNSGGINLKKQEIRTSLYHSKFYEMLYSINMDSNWRKMTPQPAPDINMKDVEIILRGFAMLVNRNKYGSSLFKFLNTFSSQAKSFTEKKVSYFENLFKSFIANVVAIDPKLFFNNDKFNIGIYESVFVALTEDAYVDEKLDIKTTTIEKVQKLKDDPTFKEASQQHTTNADNVKSRINKAKELL